MKKAETASSHTVESEWLNFLFGVALTCLNNPFYLTSKTICHCFDMRKPL